MKKIISLLLTFVMLFGIVSVCASAAQVDVVAVGADKTLNFDMNTAPWDGYKQVYCHIYDEDSNQLTNWGSKKSRCSDEDGDGIYTFNLTEREITLSKNIYYYVIFYTDIGAQQASPLELGINNYYDTAYCTGEYDSEAEEGAIPILQWRSATPKTVEQAITEYEQENDTEVETHRYYFLMPNGNNGHVGDDADGDFLNKYPLAWHTEFGETPSIFWWDSGIADPAQWTGYYLDKGDSDSVFYADVPVNVSFIIFNNSVHGGVEYDDPLSYFAVQTANIGSEYYDPGESVNYPDGLDSFDNMIYVVDPDPSYALEGFNQKRVCYGEWYYYYGDGCYGFEKDGADDVDAHCLRDDHHDENGNHSGDFEQPAEDLSTEYVCGDYIYRKTSFSTASIVKYTGQDSKEIIPATLDDYVVMKIEDNAFRGNEYLERVYFSALSSVFSIGKSAFRECTNLKEIEVADSVREIGEYAFASCSSLQTFTFPDKVSEIAPYTFKDCSFMYGVWFNANIKRIGACAFSSCSNLDELIFYALPRLNTYSLWNMTGLEKLTFYDTEWSQCKISMKAETIPTDVKISGYLDTDAHRYAQEFDREFVSMGELSVTPTETPTEPLDPSVPVLPTDPVDKNDYLFEDTFKKQYYSDHPDEYQYASYSELYYHHTDENDPQSEIDWVLVNASGNMCMPWLVKAIVGDRVFYSYNQYTMYSFRLGVYDVKDGKFYELTDNNYSKYNDVLDVLDKLRLGNPIGDADHDGTLSILDATQIQLVQAQLAQYNSKDDVTSFYCLTDGKDIDYISDIDGDGVVSVMDATAIQLKLAQLD